MISKVKVEMDADKPLVLHSISLKLSDKVIFVVWNTDLNSLSYFLRIEKASDE